jgi:hypothetical protein
LLFKTRSVMILSCVMRIEVSDELQENRLKNSASFFKGYMGVMPLVTAALAPLLTLAKAIPVFESQKTSLATFSGLFGLLFVAWVFYARGIFVPAMTGSLSRATDSGDYKPDWYARLAEIFGHRGGAAR